ncbi:type III secretion system translocon subunit SctE [Pantoea cypripedii]|uniref:type III secretion system translocon subunit SctE n=1 Tax=Pantoea cypripedii TaxID=55209 RepID=UPI002FC5A09E
MTTIVNRQPVFSTTATAYLSEILAPQKTDAKNTRQTGDVAFYASEVATELAAPRQHEKPASRTAAAESYTRVMEQVPAGESNPLAGTTLKTAEQMSVEQMFLAATLMTNQSLGEAASAKGPVLKALTEQRERLRAQQLEERKAQMAQQAEMQEQAKKGGLIGEIMAWVTAVVDLVMGIAEIAIGIISCNPMLVAGGVANTMGAMAGIGVAICHTMARLHPEDAEKYNKAAERLGYMQMAMEIAGAACSVVSAIKKAGVKLVGKAAKFAKMAKAVSMCRTFAREATQGACQIAIGGVEKKMAAIRKDIDLLILQIQFYARLMEQVDERNKEVIDQIKELQSDQGRVMENGMQLLSTISANQAKMASAMV